MPDAILLLTLRCGGVATHTKAGHSGNTCNRRHNIFDNNIEFEEGLTQCWHQEVPGNDAVEVGDEMGSSKAYPSWILDLDRWYLQG